jgi:hypothetical protein
MAHVSLPCIDSKLVTPAWLQILIRDTLVRQTHHMRSSVWLLNRCGQAPYHEESIRCHLRSD